jgi:hypothetical protein
MQQGIYLAQFIRVRRLFSLRLPHEMEIEVVEAEATKTSATTDASAGCKHKPQQYGYGEF